MNRIDRLLNTWWDLCANIGYAAEAVFDTLTDWIARPLECLGLIDRPRGPLGSILRQK
jgi:hypothetical protein